jgi:hypothetical protein
MRTSPSVRRVEMRAGKGQRSGEVEEDRAAAFARAVS